MQATNTFQGLMITRRSPVKPTRLPEQSQQTQRDLAEVSLARQPQKILIKSIVRNAFTAVRLVVLVIAERAFGFISLTNGNELKLSHSSVHRGDQLKVRHLASKTSNDNDQVNHPRRAGRILPMVNSQPHC